MTWLLLTLAWLAVDRAGRAITADAISLPIRRWAQRRWPPTNQPLYDPYGKPMDGTAVLTPSWPVKLITCQRCVTFWLSGAAALGLTLGHVVQPWSYGFLVWFGLAGACCFSASLVP